MAASSPDPIIELDAILRKVANAISKDEQIERLGRRLDFQPADVERFKQTNNKGPTVTAEGTKEMLKAWAERLSVTEALPALQAALRDTGLVQIAEIHVPGSLYSVEDGEHILGVFLLFAFDHSYCLEKCTYYNDQIHVSSS